MFEKRSNIKFHEHRSSGNRVVLCRRTDTNRQADKQTDMTKPIVAFRNFGNPPKNYNITQAWYGRLTSYIALREEHKLRTFVNMALRRTSGPNGVTQESEELYVVRSSSKVS